jgi:hypothetical protein
MSFQTDFLPVGNKYSTSDTCEFSFRDSGPQEKKIEKGWFIEHTV